MSLTVHFKLFINRNIFTISLQKVIAIINVELTQLFTFQKLILIFFFEEIIDYSIN